MSQSEIWSLPGINTSIENIIALIEVLKVKNKNDEDAKAVFDFSNGIFTSTKSALRQFGIISVESLEFTTLGKEIAFSNDEKRKEAFLSVLRGYTPYEKFLLSIQHSRKSGEYTSLEDLKNYWGRNNYGSTERNRSDAVKLFFGILDYLGLGSYTKGRGSKNPTRFVWDEKVLEIISAIFTPLSERQEETLKIDQKLFIEMPSETNKKEKVYSGDRNANIPKIASEHKTTFNVTINVDMKDWPMEKIKEFFKYLDGHDEEN